MADNQEPKNIQDGMERNIFALFLATALAVSIAGIVEIIPLFYLKSAVDYTEQTDKYGNVKNEKFPELVWERTFTEVDGKIVSDKALYKQDKMVTGESRTGKRGWSASIYSLRASRS